MERRLTGGVIAPTRSGSPSPTTVSYNQRNFDSFIEKGSVESEGETIVPPYSSLSHTARLSLSSRKLFPYPGSWVPVWKTFPLKVFRGPEFTYLKIQADWDDEMLLRELGKTYDKLRTVWRKWFSLRSVSSITLVMADHSFYHPQRIGPAGVSPSKNMRLRYLLANPQLSKDRYEFMQVFTARTDVGIEFVERFQLTRIAIAVLVPVALSLIVGVVYSAITGDVSSGFTISGYMTSAYIVCLLLIGILNVVE
ncbi:hypothetical protein NM688_g8877 [Phlebia brevispora]|uniref:Uncharacterized protein n=1 Tax=Phlebia brevispora TaxID=194682 RepID=A0ACC1RNV5_9APHY|nr:hypothetical protein NM688_g8877 [Phlebia brevispora]